MNVQTLPDLAPQSWLQRPIPSKQAAAKAAAALLLLLACAIVSPSLRRIASFILAAPILFFLTLVTLAASNVAFSFLYTRHQRRHTAKARQTKRVHGARTMPGSASRYMFQYLRPARFTRPAIWGSIEKQRRQEQAAKYRTPIADTMPQFSEAVDTLIELILRDYVAGWMRAITPEVVLQQRLEEILRNVLIQLKDRVMDLDLTQLLVTRLVPKVTEHVNDFRKAEMALRGDTLERSLTETDELDLLVASKFRGGKLHKALSTSISTQTTEEAYLRNVVQTILPTLLPKSEAQSDILQYLLREILVGAILRPVMDLLSDPDYWNQNVDFYIGNAIREQNMVKKLREVLKQHAANLDSEPSTANALDSYGNGDLLEFEEFLKMIKQCNSLLDVKQIRNAILTQIRKKRAMIAGRERDDVVNGHKVEDVIVYINKLELARRRAEKQIEALGGPAYPKRRNRDHTPESRKSSALIKLDTILTNPSGLSYFMEFQDQRENMNELQFWLLIDTLDIKEYSQSSEPGSAERSASSTPSSTYSKAHSQKILGIPASSLANSVSGSIKGDLTSSRRASIATTVDITDTLRDDVRMIYETYFAESAPRPVVVDHSLVDVFRAFALSDFSSTRTDSMSVSESRRQEDLEAANVRKSLLEAQRQVFEQMLQKDYPEFTKSDLYFKFLTSYQNSMAENNGEKRSNRGHHRGSASNPRSSPGPALLSAIGLSPLERRREGSENTKRSSAGSFLDIFGLGRDKDKENERERGQVKRAETSTTSFRPGFLSPSRARSNTASPVSIRTVDSEEMQFGSKQSSEVSSSTRPVTLTRTRSLSSISNGETHGDIGSRTKIVFPSRNSTSTGDDREGSLDFTDQDNITKSAAGDDSPALRDSLLIELQEPEEDEDDGSMGDSQVGLPIPRMSKDKRGKEKVIDAVEAALSSIMESPDIQHDDLSGSGLRESLASPSVDLIDPAFSTARDRHAGVDAMLEWGKSQKASKRRSKEKPLDSELVPGAKSKDLSRTDRESRKQCQSNHPAGAQGSVLGDQKDEKGPFRHHKAISDMSDDSNDESTIGNKGKDITPSISDTLETLNDTVQGSVHLAAPGDLLLSDRIKRLEQDIETARKYEDIIDSMIQKPELQGRENELRILKKLKSTQRREILIMEYQKTQYEVQEEENMIMPGRSTISITSSTVGHEGSKEFALYVIEVHQLAQDGSFASGWVIARRYSEFFTLHQQLKDKYPSIVRQIDLPGKRGFLKLQRSFVETRRIGLERYLQCLVQHVEICQSQELRAFLSQENVALPQFSSSTPLIPYSLFDNDDSKDGAKETNPTPPPNQFFFEQLFHSTNSPLHSPVVRDPPRGQVHFHTSAGSTDAPGAGKTDSGTGTKENEGLIRHIYQTFSDGIDDMFSGGSPTVLENITKQLGNQMIQFTMDKEEPNKSNTTSGAAAMRRRHGSHSDCDNVRLVQSEILDRNAEPSSSFDILNGPRISFSGDKVQRPDLQRIHSARSRRLSSPDPHTQHQRMQLQLQQQQQQQQDQQNPSQQQDQTQQQQHPSPQQGFQQQQHQHPVRQGVVETEGVTTFTEPLCDLFIELFELKKNNWLRRQAVVIILQQVLGGTIERKLRDTVRSYVEENMLTFYVTKLRETLWPSTPASTLQSADLSGEYQFVTEDLGLSPTLPQSRSTDEAASSSANKRVVRTAEQKASTKDQANRKLSAYLPDLLGSMVGHQNARRGARRVFAAFQNRRLNQQLVYTALDEVIAAMWPELALPSSPSSSSAPEAAGAYSLPMATPSSSTSGAASKSSTATTITSKATASSSMSTLPNPTHPTDISDSGERPGRHKPSRSKR